MHVIMINEERGSISKRARRVYGKVWREREKGRGKSYNDIIISKIREIILKGMSHRNKIK